ncbi:MAG TPA: hypothetical protein VGB26_06055 [Nitrospiria bacterium]|jgi:hypothetical protein
MMKRVWFIPIIICSLLPPQNLQAESLTNLLAEIVVTQAEYPEEQLTDLAYEVREIIGDLEENQDNPKIKNKFLDLFRGVYSTQDAGEKPQTHFVYSDTYRITNAYALLGNKEFLRALMEASQGPYGRSAEGEEWINEMLWENLEAQTQLSIDILSEVPKNLRDDLMKRVYTAPVRDEFNFQEIQKNLNNISIPVNIQKEVGQIQKVVNEFQ